jgi:hypothetical protein
VAPLPHHDPILEVFLEVTTQRCFEVRFSRFGFIIRLRFRLGVMLVIFLMVCNQLVVHSPRNAAICKQLFGCSELPALVLVARAPNLRLLICMIQRRWGEKLEQLHFQGMVAFAMHCQLLHEYI